MRTHSLRLRGGRAVLALLAVLLCGVQTRYTYSVGQQFAYQSGQSVTPAYEGWGRNEDGSFTLYFGYMNSNWQEELDVPIGPDNNIEPGGPDQGQPTHFYPRRNPFLFTIRVPKDFGTKELVWTLTSHGQTKRSYAYLKFDYMIDPQVIQNELGGGGGDRDVMRTNKPPDLKVEGNRQPTVKVGEPVKMVAFVSDPDNLPEPGRIRRGGGGIGGGRGARAAAGGGQAGGGEGGWRRNLPVPTKAGVRLSWMVYRGNAAAVTFSPEQMKTWQDSRPYSNSPWSPGSVIPDPPPDGQFVVQATFREPGTYVLRAVASDGALFTYENVTVTVTR